MKKLIVLVVAAIAVTAFSSELRNAAQTSLGATGYFTGAPNNRDWPANRAIPKENPRDNRGGCLFGGPMVGGTIHIRLVAPCNIERIDLRQLDYHYTMNVKKAEISVDGRVVKTVELEENPKVYQEVPVKAKGSVVSVKCLETFPRRRNPKTGKLGADYGGWARIRVMVTDDVESLMLPPQGYSVKSVPEALTPTGTAAAGNVKVYGKPRISKGHPRTTWDKEDVKHYRSLLKTSDEFRKFAESLRRSMDKRIKAPLGIPQPKKNAAGEWEHLMDSVYGRIHNHLALDIANLGTVYQLYGDEKYAEFARKLLLAYADAWPKYGVGSRASFRHDPSKVFDQRLSDATWLIQVAVGFDFVRESPCFSEEDIKKICDDLVGGSARFIFKNRAHLIANTNWSAIGTAAVLAAAVACDDDDLFNTAMFGHRWVTRKQAHKKPVFNRWWEGVPNDTPQGVELHFSGRSIDIDGMWAEGAMGYQFMALQALIFDAEVLWHHGIDLYSYRNGALKGLFDSPILFSYPNLVTPAIHDSGNSPIVGRESGLYEYAYLRYRDPAYLGILARVGRRLAASFQQFTLSCLWDLDKIGKPEIVFEHPSVNLNGVGYGILRVTDGEGARNLLVDYGPNRSHGHPDKLNIDLWAFDALQIPDPGVAWYETPIYRNWYRTTFAHNTLSVDMQEQSACGAELLSFTPGEGIGMMRARTDHAYPGVIMDRSLFLTRNYVADLFGAFGRLTRLYDLAWHPRGKAVEKPAGLKPFSWDVEPTVGYNQLKELESVSGKESRRVVFENRSRKYALITADGGDETEMVVGTAVINSNRGKETSVFLRRRTDSTVFGGVYDFNGSVKSVTQKGSLAKGRVELEINLADGGIDRCSASYDGGAFQTFVSVDADGKPRAIAFAGTAKYAACGISLEASAIGGAIAERTETGSWMVKNCSSTENTITFSGKFGKKSFKLAPAASAEWLVGNSRPIAEHRQKVLRQLAEKQAAEEAKNKAEVNGRIAARKAAAAKNPGKNGTFAVFQAEDFVVESGGKLRIPDNKAATIGKSISGWDADGHTVEWKISVPEKGYYNLSLVYCSDSQRLREGFVNGRRISAPEGGVLFQPTGGFSNNGSDDWRVFTWPEEDGSGALPIEFEKGENTLRMINSGGGGVNVDYFIVTSPDMKPKRIAN